MKNTYKSHLISLVIFFLGIYGCKSPLSKIDINDVDAHRNYQDSILQKSNTTELKYLSSRKLITDYLGLKEKDIENNSNYNYYLARLFNYISQLPTNGFWLDSITKKIKNPDDYKNVYDSTYIYVNKALKIDPNNLRAMNILCLTMLQEGERFQQDSSLPFSLQRDNKLHNELLNYIVNNAIRFKDYDNSTDKALSISIAKVALTFIEAELQKTGSYEYVEKDENKTKFLYVYGELYDFVKGKNIGVIKLNENFINEKIYPNVLLAKKEIDTRNKIAAEKERIAKESQIKLDLIKNTCGPYLNKYFDCQWRATHRYLRLDVDGTYTLGKWEDIEDANGKFSKSYMYTKKGRFEVKDSKNIILFDYFSPNDYTEEGSSNSNVIFYLDEFTLFGVKDLILNGRLSNGMLSHDEGMKFDATAD